MTLSRPSSRRDVRILLITTALRNSVLFWGIFWFIFFFEFGVEFRANFGSFFGAFCAFLRILPFWCFIGLSGAFFKSA